MTKTDSGSDETRTVETTTSTDSTPQSDQPNSGTVTITRAEFDSLNARLKTLENGAQSEKDRAVTKLGKKVDALAGEVKPLLERAAHYLSQGKSVDDALSLANSEQEDELTKKSLAELARAWKDGKLLTPGAGNAAGQSAEVTQVISDLKLDANSADVIQILAKGLDPEKQELELRRYAARPKTQPSAASSASLQGSPPSGKMTDVEADRKYDELGKLLRNPTFNAGKISELKKELKEAGYETD